MIRFITISIFTVFLLMGVDVSHIGTEQGIMGGIATLFVPAAIADANKDLKDSADSNGSSDSKDSANTNDGTDSKGSPASDSLICTSGASKITAVENKVTASKVVEKDASNSEKEAKNAKENADVNKTKVDDDHSASKSDKQHAYGLAKEKDTEYKSAKTEHDHALSAVSNAEKKLAAEKTKLEAIKASPTTSLCTTASGKHGYWVHSTTGNKVNINSSPTTPKSMREVFGK